MAVPLVAPRRLADPTQAYTVVGAAAQAIDHMSADARGTSRVTSATKSVILRTCVATSRKTNRRNVRTHSKIKPRRETGTAEGEVAADNETEAFALLSRKSNMKKKIPIPTNMHSH